jgi:hypothetical protein
MKPAGATTLLVSDDDAAACGRAGGARRGDGLNYRADL